MSQIPSNASAENFKLKTPRGTEFDVILTLPTQTSAKAPALVIAPGQGYHMRLPLVQQLAEAAAFNGFVVYQFNWSYYSTDPVNGQPSEDLNHEIEDMKTVLNAAKNNKLVDSSKIILAGKSLGTLVSYSIFNSDISIYSLLMMTPLCTDPDTKKPIGNESYPNFSANNRPIEIILGNTDLMCSLQMVYNFAKDSPANVSINVFGGGHSLTYGKAGDPKNAERDSKNIGAAVDVAALWTKAILQK